MWIGLGNMINKFRKNILHLSPIGTLGNGDSLLNDLNVPISHMWSPSFVPKCKDWKAHVNVVGEFRAAHEAIVEYTPHVSLQNFLNSSSQKPIYIGFGSMVIEDASNLVNMIKDAAEKVNCNVLLQSGWTKYADDNTMISKQVMVVGAMPHDWLFSNVSAVIHHGGAGTTSAGLRAGNPTFICPFFGDQHFWAEMVHRRKAGPKGCPIKQLTTEKLFEAFKVLLDTDTKTTAKLLGDEMNAENGVSNAIKSFYKNLPLRDMICEVSIFNENQSKTACFFCVDCGLKMCSDVDRVVHRNQNNKKNNKKTNDEDNDVDDNNNDNNTNINNKNSNNNSSEDRSHHNRIPFRPVHWPITTANENYNSTNVDYNIWNLFAKPEKNKKVVDKSLIQNAIKNEKKEKKNSELNNNNISEKKNNIAKPLQQKTGLTFIENMNNIFNQSSKNLLSNFDSSFSIKNEIKKNSGNDLKQLVIREAEETGFENNTNDNNNEKNDNDENESLSVEDFIIEKAYTKAMHVLKLWKLIDQDGSRAVSADELNAFFATNDDLKALMKRSLNSTSMQEKKHLTFSEFAWYANDPSIFE